MSKATAKEVSDYSDVPRTRVYDAVRVLEAQELVEVQHGNPQQFRAVPIAEAITTLRDQYESRFATLVDYINDLDALLQSDDDDRQDVWSLAGTTAIATRTQQLIADTTDELFLILGDERLLTDELVDSVSAVTDRGVSVFVGTPSESVQDAVQRRVPDAEVFVSGLDWLSGEERTNGSEAVAVGRLVLSDGSTILVSSIEPSSNEAKAVFGRGFTNGLVVILRRLLTTGLLAVNDSRELGTDAQ